MEKSEYDKALPEAKNEKSPTGSGKSKVVSIERVSPKESPAGTLTGMFILGGVCFASLVGVSIHSWGNDYLAAGYLAGLAIMSAVFALWIANERD